VFAAAQAEVAKSGLGDRCRLERGGCYGLCNGGPNVVVRPDTGKNPDPFARDNYRLTGAPGEVHYGATSVERMIAVLRQHIARGEPLREKEEPLVYDPPCGT
jgi:(2Fe-2S) ferredoxin